MSTITDIILVTAIDDGGQFEDDHPNAEKLSQWLRDDHESSNVGLTIMPSRPIENGRAIQCDIFLAAVNHLHTEAFIAAFRAIEWQHPDCVQLMLKGEHDDLFTVYHCPERPTLPGDWKPLYLGSTSPPEPVTCCESKPAPELLRRLLDAIHVAWTSKQLSNAWMERDGIAKLLLECDRAAVKPTSTKIPGQS
jgi:hypothetical protein